MNRIIVKDAIMGSGKTTMAIEKMKRSKNNFLYVTPFLNEVERIKNNVPGVKSPESTKFTDYSGCLNSITKRDSILKLANRNCNIATTHSLFQRLKPDDYSLFSEYELILDEVIDPLSIVDITSDDIDCAFKSNIILENRDTGNIVYTGNSYNGKYFSKLKHLCETRNVTYINNRFLIWAFPPKIFRSFSSVTILTYLFEGSSLYSYMKFYGLPFKIEKDSKRELEIKNSVKKLLKVYDGICNNVGKSKNAFSVNWLKNRNGFEIKKIKTTTAHLVERNFKSKSENTCFTTFKEFQEKLKGKGYSKGFIPVNERATNAHSQKNTMIYLANRFINPEIIQFYNTESIEFNQDKWALGELLQWIWRGSIRNEKEMNLYLPSKRMRNLFHDWLYDVNTYQLKKTS